MSHLDATPAPDPRAWTKPRLVRLGTIADVRGTASNTGQVVSMVNTKS